MAQLPHAERAVLDIAKLEHYCLDASHPRGRHKARVFRTALGINQRDAAWLRNVLLAGTRQSDATRVATDAFGTRWRVDIRLARQERTAVVRTIWIVKSDEAVPRFVTCWVL